MWSIINVFAMNNRLAHHPIALSGQVTLGWIAYIFNKKRDLSVGLIWLWDYFGFYAVKVDVRNS